MAAMLMVRLSSIKLMMQAMLTLLQGGYTLIPMMLVLLHARLLVRRKKSLCGHEDGAFSDDSLRLLAFHSMGFHGSGSAGIQLGLGNLGVRTHAASGNRVVHREVRGSSIRRTQDPAANPNVQY